MGEAKIPAEFDACLNSGAICRIRLRIGLARLLEQT
jgi:hypothetical protein